MEKVAYVPPQNSTELLTAQGPVGSSSSCSTGTPILSILTGSGYTLRGWGGKDEGQTRREEGGKRKKEGGRRESEEERRYKHLWNLR